MRAFKAGIVILLLTWYGLAWAGSHEAVAAYKRGDYATAEREFRVLARRGHASAQLVLGNMYYNGRGVSQDYKEAVKWYMKAAEQGIASAQSDLGLMYANGEGVPQDYVQAHMWFNIAGANGVAGASESRDLVAKHMTPAQIAEAQKLTSQWMKHHH